MTQTRLDVKCVTCTTIVKDAAERACAIVQCPSCKQVPHLFAKGRKEMIVHMHKDHDCDLRGLDMSNAT